MPKFNLKLNHDISTQVQDLNNIPEVTVQDLFKKEDMESVINDLNNEFRIGKLYQNSEKSTEPSTQNNSVNRNNQLSLSKQSTISVSYSNSDSIGKNSCQSNSEVENFLILFSENSDSDSNLHIENNNQIIADNNCKSETHLVSEEQLHDNHH